MEVMLIKGQLTEVISLSFSLSLYNLYIVLLHFPAELISLLVFISFSPPGLIFLLLSVLQGRISFIFSLFLSPQIHNADNI